MSTRRRSLRIAGHATSVSLEDAFWDELRRIAREQGRSTADLVAAIDRERTADLPTGKAPPNLSSALRLYVLDRLRGEARRAPRNA